MLHDVVNIIYYALSVITIILALVNLILLFEDMSKTFVKVLRISLGVSFVLNAVMFIVSCNTITGG